MVVFHNLISIDGAGFDVRGGKKYESEVLHYLRIVNSNHVGRILLHWLRAIKGKHSIAMYPYKAHRCEKDFWSFSAPTNLKSATPAERNVRDSWGRPIPTPTLDRAHHRIEDPVTGQVVMEPMKGTGGGSNTVIGFTPGRFTHQQIAGLAPDHVLVHELTHSYRQMRGHVNKTAVGCVVAKQANGSTWSENYPNMEEFLAVMIQNIYQSASGTGGALRGEYFSNVVKGQLRYRQVPDSGARDRQGALQTGMTPSETFVLEHYGRVTQLYREETGLAHDLAQIKCTFNPFRDYEAKLTQGSR
ncbi:MAG: M91 family zinc metallopeptidase [Bryobacteraceae bacterium]